MRQKSLSIDGLRASQVIGRKNPVTNLKVSFFYVCMWERKEYRMMIYNVYCTCVTVHIWNRPGLNLVQCDRLQSFLSHFASRSKQLLALIPRGNNHQQYIEPWSEEPQHKTLRYRLPANFPTTHWQQIIVLHSCAPCLQFNEIIHVSQMRTIMLCVIFNITGHKVDQSLCVTILQEYSFNVNLS